MNGSFFSYLSVVLVGMKVHNVPKACDTYTFLELVKPEKFTVSLNFMLGG
tara:strand:- start:2096 stop:2245 length:150 start_codon:yes stop_codon:yes gene_type:complete